MQRITHPSIVRGFGVGTVLLCVLMVCGGARAGVSVSETLGPRPGAINEADLELDGPFPSSPQPGTSEIEADSRVDVTYDGAFTLLAFDGGTLHGSDVRFELGGVALDDLTATDIEITILTTPILAEIGVLGDGSFAAPATISVSFSAMLAVNDGPANIPATIAQMFIELDGTLVLDGDGRIISLEQATATIPAIPFLEILPGVDVTLSGTIALDLGTELWVDGFESGTFLWSGTVPP